MDRYNFGFNWCYFINSNRIYLSNLGHIKNKIQVPKFFRNNIVSDFPNIFWSLFNVKQIKLK